MNRFHQASIIFQSMLIFQYEINVNQNYVISSFVFMYIKIDKASSLLNKVKRLYMYFMYHVVSLQLHMVHFSTKYGTITNAIDKKDGIAVVAVLFKVFSNPFRLSIRINHILKKKSFITLYLISVHYEGGRV